MVVVKFYRWRFCIVFLQPACVLYSLRVYRVQLGPAGVAVQCTVYSVQCTEKLARVTLATDLTDWWLVVWRRPAWHHLYTMLRQLTSVWGRQPGGVAEGVAAAGAPQRPGDSDGEGGQPSYHQLLQHRPRAQAAHGQHRGPWPGVLWRPRRDHWHVVTLASAPVCGDWSVTGVCVWSELISSDVRGLYNRSRPEDSRQLPSSACYLLLVTPDQSSPGRTQCSATQIFGRVPKCKRYSLLEACLDSKDPKHPLPEKIFECPQFQVETICCLFVKVSSYIHHSINIYELY